MPPSDKLHDVNAGPRGTFKKSGAVHSSPQDVDRILAHIRASEPSAVALYFHGGLKTDKSALAIAANLEGRFAPTDVHVVTILWETGPLDAIAGQLRRLGEKRLFNKLLDYAIRHAAEWLDAKVDAKGAGQLMTLDEVAALRQSDGEMQIMDRQARGPGGVDSDADIEMFAGEIELAIQADLAADVELDALLQAGPETEDVDPKLMTHARMQEHVASRCSPSGS